MYVRGASIALLVYDMMSSESRDAIKQWYECVSTTSFMDTVVVVVATKEDLKVEKAPNQTARPAVDPPPEALFDRVMFCECSPKTGKGVEELFTMAANEAIARFKVASLRLPNDPEFRKQFQPAPSKSSSSSCTC